MFSSTTMAASTTMPTAKAIPARLITFSDRPRTAIATNEPTTDTGIAIATTAVGRHDRRKIIRMVIASTPP